MSSKYLPTHSFPHSDSKWSRIKIHHAKFHSRSHHNLFPFMGNLSPYKYIAHVIMLRRSNSHPPPHTNMWPSIHLWWWREQESPRRSINLVHDKNNKITTWDSLSCRVSGETWVIRWVFRLLYREPYRTPTNSQVRIFNSLWWWIPPL